MSSNPSSSVPAVVVEAAPVSAHTPGKITQAELEKHAEIKDMWLLISGKGKCMLSGSVASIRSCRGEGELWEGGGGGELKRE